MTLINGINRCEEAGRRRGRAGGRMTFLEMYVVAWPSAQASWQLLLSGPFCIPAHVDTGATPYLR